MTGVSDPVPLIVDVDGTLLRSDLLHEAALGFVASHPLSTWRLLVWLAGGKANLKAELAARVGSSVDSIPLRDEVVAAVREAQQEQRPVFLASASDKRWVDAIAERLGGVAGVLASDGVTNLAGSAKAAALVERFGAHGFDYIGDNRVDFPVWDMARRQLLVSHSAGLEKAVKARFPDSVTVARVRAPLRAHIRALRLHQWAKNLLVFLPIIAGHHLGDPARLLATIVAFFAFSLAASSAYIINDLLDLPGDRDHATKRRRPFAAGDIPIVRGLAMTTTLMAAAILLATLLPPRFLVILAGYVVLTLGYSLVLKRRLLIDVITLGGLYTIRVLGGVAATGEHQSPWLLMFSLFLFLSLATVKRCSELVARRDAGKQAPLGRGYEISDIGVLFPLAAAAGYGAVLVVTLYLSSPEVATLYTYPMRMWLICPLLLYWISRVLVLSSRGTLHEDPVIFALTDRVSWVVALLAGGVIVLAT
ncbi:UbiA family prenyltransferase [Sphingomonas sp. HMWF008]|nr:UbiA family prenyltransferase [Sphingomonas sp. HMWF008]